MHYLETLNSAQRRAAEVTEGPLLILAGAGAGKTKTLTHRIVHLIKKGVEPGEILAVTFTNKAAHEMKQRVEKLLFELHMQEPSSPFIATFHSLGVFILRQEFQHHSRTKYFTIFDQKDSIALVKESVIEKNLDPKVHEPKKIKHIISQQKNQGVTQEEYARRVETYMGEIISSVWELYEKKLIAENGFDFDDLLLYTMLLLENNKEVSEKYTEKWKYVHIDEYQDTNETQYRITKALSKHGNICVVGDGDQTIYTWRGANVTNILDFEKDYSDAVVVTLEQNYRSTQKILEVANTVIKKNKKRKEKNLFTHNDEGEDIVVFQAINDRKEAQFVQKNIQELHTKHNVPYEDMAILYRANFQSRLLEEALLSSRIPHIVLGVRFFDRKEVKDVLSYIRGALSPDSRTDIKRIINTPKRGIGKVTLTKLFSGQKDSLPASTLAKVNGFFNLLKEIQVYAEKSLPSEVVRFVIEKSGVRQEYVQSKNEEDMSRIENMEEMIAFALRYDGQEDGLLTMLEDAALASDQDSLSSNRNDTTKPGVKLMTVHSAKGLEFPYVFVVGLEHDLFPHSFGGVKDSKSDQEEERRLFYVAVTRAEKQLFLSYAGVRYIHGEQHLQEPSEFIQDISEDIAVFESEYESHSSSFDDSQDTDDGPFEYLVID